MFLREPNRAINRWPLQVLKGAAFFENGADVLHGALLIWDKLASIEVHTAPMFLFVISDVIKYFTNWTRSCLHFTKTALISVLKSFFPLN